MGRDGDCAVVTITLRPYQAQLKSEVYQAWDAGHRNVLAVLPTGGGKSICVTDVLLDGHNQGMREVVMAHRNELVSQMSLHVAKRGIPHRIIGSKSTITGIIREHRTEFGRSFVNPDANCAVGSVQTIMSRADDLEQWGRQVNRWTLDEAHHAIGNETAEPNIWGKAIKLFPNATGLGVTACPQRADGKGLGRHADGPFDHMVIGPNMRELINEGSLSQYEIVVPQSDFEIGDDAITAKGDYSPKKMRAASEKSHIVGDVVTEYLKWAAGKRAICFATDVETANEIASRFNDAGVAAASVSAKTDTGVRRDMIARFRDGRLHVLVNVDLFDEGFDVPACEVVIMARPTASLNKYLQMFGRGMRVFAGKWFGLVIDHVSNWKRHGLPDKPHHWTLDRREKRARKEPDPDDVPLTVCRECSRPYEKPLTQCPYCGAEPPVPEPGSRTIEQVDGDLVLVDREAIQAMLAAAELESPASVQERVSRAAGDIAGRGAANRMIERHASQQQLRETIEQWAGWQRHKGEADRVSHKRFYLATGMTVLQALSLSRAEMDDMTSRIEGWIPHE